MSEGTKFDSGKPPMGLLPWPALIQVAKVLKFGKEKYDAHNWRGGMNWSRMYDAALRHLTAFMEGEDIDQESGLHHLAHCGCCILFLLTYCVTETGTDDRYKAAPCEKRIPWWERDEVDSRELLTDIEEDSKQIKFNY